MGAGSPVYDRDSKAVQRKGRRDMRDMQRWIEENRPTGDPDYQRLTDVTEAIEAEIRDSGAIEVLNKYFDYDMTQKYGMRRMEETSRRIKLENPSFDTLLPLLRSSWSEGFAFGSLVFSREHRGQRAEPFLDRIALANVNHLLAEADQDTLDAIYSELVSPATLAFVSTARSIQAVTVLRSMAPVAGHALISATVASHWMDGFLVGLSFQKTGGHRKG